MHFQERAILHCHPSDTAVVLNMDNSRDLDMDVLIKNIDSWYQNVAQRSKEEANLFYQNQVCIRGWLFQFFSVHLGNQKIKKTRTYHVLISDLHLLVSL